MRFLSYLAPGLPEAMFEAVVAHVGASLGCPVSLAFETRTSGPRRGEADPFTRQDADIGFLCSPSYIWLTERRPPAVRLLAAPVFADPRCGGRPVYYSDVIVRADNPARSFDQLRGCTWAFNDLCSLSGFFSLMQRLRGYGEPFFHELIDSGAHRTSVRLVLEGKAHAAAIDSNVLALVLKEEPALASKLRVLDSWGPHPLQPVVAASSLSEGDCERIAQALLSFHLGAESRSVKERFGLVRFARVSEADYAKERMTIGSCDLDHRRLAEVGHPRGARLKSA